MSLLLLCQLPRSVKSASPWLGCRGEVEVLGFLVAFECKKQLGPFLNNSIRLDLVLIWPCISIQQNVVDILFPIHSTVFLVPYNGHVMDTGQYTPARKPWTGG